MKTHTKRIIIRCKPEFFEQFKEQCEKSGVPMSVQFRKLAISWMKRKKAEGELK